MHDGVDLSALAEEDPANGWVDVAAARMEGLGLEDDKLPVDNEQNDASDDAVDADVGVSMEMLDQDDDSTDLNVNSTNLQDDDSEDDEVNDGSDTSQEDGNPAPRKPPNITMLHQFRAFADPGRFIAPLQPEDVTGINLMEVLRQKKAPNNAYSAVSEWHLRDKGSIRDHD